MSGVDPAATITDLSGAGRAFVEGVDAAQALAVGMGEDIRVLPVGGGVATVTFGVYRCAPRIFLVHAPPGGLESILGRIPPHGDVRVRDVSSITFELVVHGGGALDAVRRRAGTDDSMVPLRRDGSTAWIRVAGKEVRAFRHDTGSRPAIALVGERDDRDHVLEAFTTCPLPLRTVDRAELAVAAALSPGPVLVTRRLLLRPLSPDDADFVLELLNDETYVRFLGDRNIHTVDAARDVIERWVEMTNANGFGLYAMEPRGGGPPMGLCGLLKRPWLEDVDVGYGLLATYRGRGYAREAAVAVLEWGREHFGLQRVVALVAEGNARSIHLLEQLGMRYERRVIPPDDEPESMLYALPPVGAPAANAPSADPLPGGRHDARRP
jgi:RimJ/RimL family protein N-acetyltransferase